MAVKRIILIAKRVAGGDWMHFTREGSKPFQYHVSGGSLREESGTSILLAGQQEAAVQVFPDEQVEILEEVQA